MTDTEYLSIEVTLATSQDDTIFRLHQLPELLTIDILRDSYSGYGV